MWKRADELVERLSAALPMAAASVSRPDRNVKTTWGSVHSLPGQRFTRHFLLIPWRGRFLRFRDHIGQARHGRLRHPVVAPDPMMQAESPGGQDRKASGARHLDLVRWLDDESHAPMSPPGSRSAPGHPQPLLLPAPSDISSCSPRQDIGRSRLDDNAIGVNVRSGYPLQKMPLKPANTWFFRASWRSLSSTAAMSSTRG